MCEIGHRDDWVTSRLRQIEEYKTEIRQIRAGIKEAKAEVKTLKDKLDKLPVIDAEREAKKRYRDDRKMLKANSNILAYKFEIVQNTPRLLAISAPVVVDKFTKQQARDYYLQKRGDLSYFDEWYKERKPYMGFNLGRFAISLRIHSTGQIVRDFIISLDQSTSDYYHPSIQGSSVCLGEGGELFSKVGKKMSFNRAFNFLFDWLKFPFLNNAYMHGDDFVAGNNPKVFPNNYESEYWSDALVVQPIISLLKEIK